MVSRSLNVSMLNCLGCTSLVLDDTPVQLIKITMNAVY